MEKFFSPPKQRLIYVLRIPYDTHKGCLKIGETTFESERNDFQPNSSALNKAAHARIAQYTQTAGISAQLLHTEMAVFEKDGRMEGFTDKMVHKVLLRSGIEKKIFDTVNKADEWFITDLETAKRAIAAVKDGRRSLHPSEISEGQSPVELRPNQEEAIAKTLKQFKRSNQMLWNAKMRFGKTLAALEMVKRHGGFRRVLIISHRPVVNDSWFEDFGKVFYDTDNFRYGSKTHGESYANLERQAQQGECSYVYFASMQDLRGSELVGGNFDKNNELFATQWDLLIVDESHEGTQTLLGKGVRQELVKKGTKALHLSGTPYNQFNEFKEDEIYTWDYVMEQRAKKLWYDLHPFDPNPYAELPRLNIYTYDLGRLLHDFVDEDIAFNFREFFRTKADGTFIHEKDVWSFLNLLSKEDENSLYPFANDTYRSIFRHTLWKLPGVKAAKAMSALLKAHPVFGCFNIVNVAGDGDEDEEYSEALRKVEKAIGDNPDETYTITLSCGRLTTGVSVKAWTGVLMLSGSYNTGASSYMQTIFRVQTPATINGRVKEDCYVFDFAPDRTLKVFAEVAKISTKAGEQDASDRQQLGEFLNFCPIISIEGSTMQQFDVDGMLQQLKRVYVEQVVRNGFEDKALYNDELNRLSDIEIADFKDLKGIIGQTKAMKKSNDIDINKQGLTQEEYEKQKQLEAKKKKELTEEEKAFLEEAKKKSKIKEDAISILRGISIRMPLLIYGAEITDEDKQLTIDNFTQLVDPQSWEEFMPKGVTKQKFNAFKKYYDPDIFAAAGKRIRQMARAADNLTIEERIERFSSIFATFRNPDKETVLTPWRVVNMHMSDTIGGYCFYNEDFTASIDEPRFVDRGKVTADVFSPDSHILEINSKTGLYPLYLAYNVYRALLRDSMFSPETIEEHQAIWDKAVAESIFVICKTPMAKSITQRTLVGFRKAKVNTRYFEDLINQIKNKPDNFIVKVAKGKSFWKANDNDNMKFKAIVGNPPYQVMDGGAGVSAIPVYQNFVDISNKINPQYCSLIMPAKWYVGGKGLDVFREKMLSDCRIRRLYDFKESREVFPSADIAGGICYFLIDSKYNGKCIFTSIFQSKRKTCERILGEHSTFVRDSEAINIISKAASKREIMLDNIVFSRKPFGISTNFIGKSEQFENSVSLYGSQGISYIDVDEITTNKDLLESWKVICSYASAQGGRADKDGKRKVLPKVEVLNPNVVCSETYLLVYHFNDAHIAKCAAKYLQTKFFRFLLSLRVITQHISKDSFAFVPTQDFTSNSDIDWSKSIDEIDAQLYAKYELTNEEISFIESMIKPM